MDYYDSLCLPIASHMYQLITMGPNGSLWFHLAPFGTTLSDKVSNARLLVKYNFCR